MRRRTKKELPVALTLSALLLLFSFGPASARELEYQVKASYLYNFIRFVTWPPDVFESDGKFNVCTASNERFSELLNALAGESVDGRTIVVKRIPVATPTSSRCHLLFLGEAWTASPPAIERGLLVVGETPGFLERGGMINLVEVQGRIRFEVNAQAAKQAGLVMSSRLLNLAMERQ